MAGPGKILHKGQGPTQLGCLTADQSRAEIVAKAMTECGVPEVELVPDVRELLWSKLFVNIGINPICAITGELNRSIAENPQSRKVSEMLVREAVEVANATGMRFDYDAAMQHVIDIALITGGNVCSMLADVRNRRRTEIDRINGAAVSEAAKVGMKAPLNEMITALIHAKELAY